MYVFSLFLLFFSEFHYYYNDETLIFGIYIYTYMMFFSLNLWKNFVIVIFHFLLEKIRSKQNLNSKIVMKH